MERAIQKDAKRSLALKIAESNDVRFKSVVVLGLLTAALLLLLWGDQVTYIEPRASVALPLKGVDLLFMLFTGRRTLHGRAGKQAFTIEAPNLLPAAFGALLFSLAVLMLVVGILCLVLKKRVYGLGAAVGAWSLVCVLFYAAAITLPGLRATDRTGAQLSLYQVYEFGLALPAAALLVLFASGVQLALKEKTVRNVKRYWFIYCLLIVPMVCMAVFCYYPIFMQVVVSFKDYKIAQGIWGSQWAGLENFRTIFQSKEILGVIANSVYLSVLRIAVTTAFPILLALFLYELHSPRYRQVVQSIVYIPHFFSWVIIYSVFYALLGNSGIINQLLATITGNGTFYIDFLTNSNTIIPTLLVSQVWKEMGWGTILYMAALSNIDPTLYEAASIDGAGALRKLLHITLPGIMSVVVFLFILSLGSILNNGLEQILLFANLAVRDRVNTIELWVYNQGIGKLDYGISSAVGFAQSLLGLVLVLCANKLSIKTTDRGLW